MLIAVKLLLTFTFFSCHMFSSFSSPPGLLAGVIEALVRCFLVKKTDLWRLGELYHHHYYNKDVVKTWKVFQVKKNTSCFDLKAYVLLTHQSTPLWKKSYDWWSLGRTTSSSRGCKLLQIQVSWVHTAIWQHVGQSADLASGDGGQNFWDCWCCQWIYEPRLSVTCTGHCLWLCKSF